jgi:hypothetical protein
MDGNENRSREGTQRAQRGWRRNQKDRDETCRSKGRRRFDRKCLVQNRLSTGPDGVTNPFVQKHHADVMGVLRGFDRLRFAGTFRALYHPPVMEKYIQKTGFLEGGDD